MRGGYMILTKQNKRESKKKKKSKYENLSIHRSFAFNFLQEKKRDI